MEKSIIEKQPIGALVKKADQVFTQVKRKTTDNGNFNRIEWQFLNFIKERKAAPDIEVVDFLSFFERRDPIQQLIEKFINQGIIVNRDKIIGITAKGEQVFKEVSKIQEEIKVKSSRNITEADYNTTLATLQKFIDNLKEYLPEAVDLKSMEEEKKIKGYDDVDRPADRQIIEEIIAKLEFSHNQKDPEAMIRLFANDAVFVNAIGIRIYGKENIYNSAQNVMKTTLAKSYAKYEISQIRFIKEDVAQVDVVQHPININGEFLKDETAGIPTFTLLKNTSGDWNIISGQNTLVIKF